MKASTDRRRPLLALAACAGLAAGAAAQIPHNQDRPPNEPYSPEDAIARMKVPPGFRVELVAAEPDLVNPVAMAFDARGRIWVTESVEYPRLDAGPGRDRIKVLEDADGDGRVDSVSVFADGLNIPSGIAIGHGGVWVANSPDLLLLRDTDGDGRADRREVVVTGFGRSDVHELPNSLTWGPDGWLYGLNGVFNPSVIRHQGREHRFTCALFRVHPTSRRFEVFAEGTSNPWGVAFDGEGSAFVSACVIDHLWHLTESGYYERQGGPYPPHTWKLGSIVGHTHQKAAYCGICWFDSDAYPEPFRERLYMGNIHGNCINVDRLERDGSTYLGRGEPDFLTADDAWFMPVAQKVGPDGCLYVLDWYDRYHCYQDARRDPEGIDRLKGRLYRVRYGDAPRARPFDLERETDDELIARLGSANVFFRRTAERILCERDGAGARARLEALAASRTAPRKQRLHALWALIGTGRLREDLHLALLGHDDPTFRAWAVRAAGNFGEVADAIRERVVALAADPSADVQLQVAISARKIAGLDPVEVLADVLERCGDDEVIAHVVWQNLHPLLAERADAFLARVAGAELGAAPALREILPRAVARVLDADDPRPATVVALLAAVWRHGSEDGASRCADALVERLRSGVIGGARLSALGRELEPVLRAIRAGARSDALRVDAAILAAAFGDASALETAREVFGSPERDASRRAAALEALVAAADPAVVDLAGAVLARDGADRALRRSVLASLARVPDPRVGATVLASYARLPVALKPAAVELLVQRAPWRRALVDAVAAGRVPPGALNANQLRALLAGGDPDLAAKVGRIWTVRAERRADREQAIAHTRALLRAHKGDPHAGAQVFARICAQCHRIYGAGQADLGPDLTDNGRGSLAQLLSNVLDPNLVVGTAYQTRGILTEDGRSLVGMVVERDERKVVLGLAGGTKETIPVPMIERELASPLSLMPEALETTMSAQELVDLFALLTLDGPPDDPRSKPIDGAVVPEARAATDPAEFAEIIGSVAPGFSSRASGEGGVALLPEFRGRAWVVRTHPVSRERPCTLARSVELPAEGRLALKLAVARYERPRADWRLVVLVDGETVHDRLVGPDTAEGGWADVEVDLSRFAGRRVRIEIENRANDWFYEFGYFGLVRLAVDGRAF